MSVASSSYLLTKIKDFTLAFPKQWVRDILVIERNKILHLPFYDPSLLGIVHREGNIVPLVSGRVILGEKQPLRQSTSMAVRLCNLDSLTGVGILVDDLLGNSNREELAEEKIFQPDDLSHPVHCRSTAVPADDSHSTSQLLWQPQRWHSQV